MCDTFEFYKKVNGRLLQKKTRIRNLISKRQDFQSFLCYSRSVRNNLKLVLKELSEFSSVKSSCAFNDVILISTNANLILETPSVNQPN